MGLKGIGSVLAGSFHSSFTQTNVFNGVEALTSWEDDRFVSILEAELGITYEYNNCWHFSLGYQMAAWFNAVTTPEWVQAVHTTTFTNVSDTITFDGVVARIEYLW